MGKKLLILLLIGAGAWFGYRYWQKKKEADSKAAADTGVKYEAMTLVNSKGKAYISVDGKVEENDTKKVYVDKKLKVKEIFVKEGDYVEKGQLLMTFDENERNNTERKIEREQLTLSKLRRNLEVEKNLLAIGGSSKNAVLEIEENIRTSEINIEEYEEDLKKTVERIESPVSGTITSLTAEENYSVNTEQPLMEITDLTEIKIILEVPEYDIVDIKLGQRIELRPEVYEKKRAFPGKVADISKISKTSSTTSENVVEVEVKPDEPIPDIVPGFKVSASIFLDAGEGLNIPKTALLEENGAYYVYALDLKSGILSKKQIALSDVRKGDDVEVKEGLALGDTILIKPNENMKDGEKVEFVLRQAQGGRRGSEGRQGGGSRNGLAGGGGPPPM
ncbi:MAG: efflux RND transporter periplasmic adaptor subunit [Fusobacteriaceae bacterium]|jgi:RND family efflux transporter MFP subunit|nr:efflux RND transporter periplasmic adaptor subunit [Fusobacteriaceae bacterium]